MVQLAPMVAPRRTSVGRVCSSTSDERSSRTSGSVARGKRSLVNTVWAATITPFSSVTAEQM